MNADPPNSTPSFTAAAWIDVAPLVPHARRAGTIVANTRDTHWITASVLGEVVACAGVIRLPREEYRLKNHFVLPTHRRCGLAGQMIALSLDWCREQNGRVVHVLSRHSWMTPLYNRHGFVTLKARANGGLHLHLSLENV